MQNEKIVVPSVYHNVYCEDVGYLFIERGEISYRIVFEEEHGGRRTLYYFY